VGAFVARVAAEDRDAGSAGRVSCVTDPIAARMFKLLPVSVPSADSRAEYRLVTADDSAFDREVPVCVTLHRLTVESMVNAEAHRRH